MWSIRACMNLHVGCMRPGAQACAPPPPARPARPTPPAAEPSAKHWRTASQGLSPSSCFQGCDEAADLVAFYKRKERQLQVAAGFLDTQVCGAGQLPPSLLLCSLGRASQARVLINRCAAFHSLVTGAQLLCGLCPAVLPQQGCPACAATATLPRWRPLPPAPCQRHCSAWSTPGCEASSSTGWWTCTASSR